MTPAMLASPLARLESCQGNRSFEPTFAVNDRRTGEPALR